MHEKPILLVPLSLFFFWGLTAHMHHLVFGGSMVPINMGFKLYLLIFLFIKFVVIKFIKNWVLESF